MRKLKFVLQMYPAGILATGFLVLFVNLDGVVAARKLCGSRLAETLDTVCFDSYGDDDYFLKKEKGHRNKRRGERLLSDESVTAHCCRVGCSIDQLMAYCRDKSYDVISKAKLKVPSTMTTETNTQFTSVDVLNRLRVKYLPFQLIKEPMAMDADAIFSYLDKPSVSSDASSKQTVYRRYPNDIMMLIHEHKRRK